MTRVVVTGMGCLTSLGNDRVSTWDGLRAGRSGVARLTAFDPSDLPSQVAGEVKGFDPVELLGRKDARRTSRGVALAVAAARQAVADSGIDLAPETEDAAVTAGVGCRLRQRPRHEHGPERRGREQGFAAGPG